MRNTKIFKFGAFIFLSLILISSVGLVAAFSTSWNFIKMSGVIKATDGIIYESLSQSDQQDVINSIESISGKPNYEPKSEFYQAIDHQTLNKLEIKNSFEVAFDSTGKKDVFKFHVINNGDKNIIIPDKYRGLELVHDREYSKYILEYNNDLYSLDPLSYQVQKILYDNVGGYDKQALNDKINSSDEYLSWASMPSIDLTGKYIAFVTNRKSVATSTEGTEVWLKNLDSGVERPIFNSGVVAFTGWDSKYNLYFVANSNLYQLNVESGEQKILDNDLFYSYFVEPTLITTKDHSINIINVDTLESHEFYNSHFHIFSLGKVSDYGTRFAVEHSPDPEKPETEILVMEIDSMICKILSPPQGYFFAGMSWFDSKTLIVTLHKLGTVDEQESYFVDIGVLEATAKDEN